MVMWVETAGMTGGSFGPREGTAANPPNEGEGAGPRVADLHRMIPMSHMTEEDLTFHFQELLQQAEKEQQ